MEKNRSIVVTVNNLNALKSVHLVADNSSEPMTFTLKMGELQKVELDEEAVLHFRFTGGELWIDVTPKEVTNQLTKEKKI